jgi:hypothetical protein
MEGIISGDKEVMSQIAQLSEKQTQEALASQQAAAAAGGWGPVYLDNNHRLPDTLPAIAGGAASSCCRPCSIT